MAKTDDASVGVSHRGPDPRAERSRAAALTAAQQLLIEDGWAAVTHVAVAARSGVGRTTLYRHWPESAMLIRDVLARSFEVEHSAPTGDLRADLISELRAFRGMLLDSVAERALRVMIERAAADRASAIILEDCHRKGTELLREIVEAAKVRGELPADLTADAAIDKLAGPMLFKRLFFNGTFDDGYVTDLADRFLDTYALPQVQATD
ncbi:TetR-like C-terminal domain-containing protein [Streptomyces sp. 796.1]|uniref:TetR-like C-terminal domain-containing protein n=1 Tax=unclassified Streptomyces TaxID=2593676 RepID=UPI0032EC3587